MDALRRIGRLPFPAASTAAPASQAAFLVQDVEPLRSISATVKFASERVSGLWRQVNGYALGQYHRFMAQVMDPLGPAQIMAQGLGPAGISVLLMGTVLPALLATSASAPLILGTTDEIHTIRPYGDRENDGQVQMTLTLRVPMSARAKQAAIQMAQEMGFTHVEVAHMESAGQGFTIFFIFAHTSASVDFSKIVVPEVEVPEWDFKTVNTMIKERLHRKIVVVGACTGMGDHFDAHTVGIDAILNMKGFKGEKGLEAYPWFETHNLGAQVDHPRLLAQARDVKADAILVSQVISEKDMHIETARVLRELARKQGMRDVLFILGGPRLDHKIAVELGYDAGFGPGTTPLDVARFIADAVTKKVKMPPASPG